MPVIKKYKEDLVVGAAIRDGKGRNIANLLDDKQKKISETNQLPSSLVSGLPSYYDVETVKQTVSDCLEAKNVVGEAVTKIKAVTLGTWPAVMISKDYYQELRDDEVKWLSFMTQYDGYMLYVIQSEDIGPILPTPTENSFRGFGSKFGFKFGVGGTAIQQKGFGSKFGCKFG